MSKREYFNHHAERWNELYHQEDSKQLEALTDRFEIKKGDWILDVGTGTGILLLYLVKQIGREDKLFALDFSSEMLSLARSRLPDARISFVNSDVGKIRLKNELIDRVICFAFFPHFSDKPKALREMSRVLKKGGKLFIAHLLSSKKIKEHHLEAGEEGKNDTIPPGHVMKKMMMNAKFKGIRIMDQPSLYFAQGEKW